MSEPTLDLSEIVDLYKADAQRMVQTMRSALLRWEELAQGGPARQELRRLAHQLRGSGRTYGFRNVTRLAKAMEHIVQDLEASILPADERTRKALAAKIERLASIFGK